MEVKYFFKMENLWFNGKKVINNNKDNSSTDV